MPVATCDAGYAETYGTDADCPERELWRAVLRQAADDLFSSNERIRADAIAFFQGADLLQVMAYAGIDCSCAPLLRERARAIYQQSGRLRRRHPITYQGRTHTIEEWAKLSGLSIYTLSHRLRNGWSATQALSTPVRRSPA